MSSADFSPEFKQRIDESCLSGADLPLKEKARKLSA